MPRLTATRRSKRPHIARSRPGPIARKFSVALALLAGVLVLVAGLVLILASYDAQLDQVIVRQQKTAAEALSVSSTYLMRAQDILWAYGQAGSVESILLRGHGLQEQQLQIIVGRYPDLFQELVLLDAEGAELAKVSRLYTFLPHELDSWAGLPAFERAMQGDPLAGGQAWVAPRPGYPVVTMAVPLADTLIVPGASSPPPAGVLAAEVGIRGMWDALANVQVGQTGYAYIVDADSGQIVGHSDLNRFLALQGQSLEQVPVVRRAMAGQTTFPRRYQGLSGETVIGAVAPFPNTSWLMIVELPLREALAGVRQMYYLLAGLVVLGAAGAAGLGLVVPRRLLRPLVAVQKGAQEIMAGNLDHVIRVRTGDERQDLADTFNQMAARLRAAHRELEEKSLELESSVAERTQDLLEASRRVERRVAQLQTGADVARTIASVHDLELLLPQVVQLTGQRFGWYHVGIFLLDQVGEYAVLRAASSEGGRRMLARRHALRVGSEGIVGTVAATGQPRVALDVGHDAVYFDTPELHQTRSEMALPLQAGEPPRVIGVLDVQSTEPDAYDQEDVDLLRTLADQVAVAIENARLFAEKQQALEEVQALHRQYVKQEWSRVVSRQDLAYEYRRESGPAAADDWPPELVVALQQRQVVTTPAGGEPNVRAALAAPIKLREQVIGGLDLQQTDRDRRWTDDEITLIQAISDQVGLALENARLLADTQRRAEQLATLHRVGLDITSALDLNGVLQALYEQVSRIVPVSLFYVTLYDEASGTIEFPLVTGVDGPLELPPIDVRADRAGPAHPFALLSRRVVESGQALHVPDLQAPDDVNVRALGLSPALVLPNGARGGAPRGGNGGNGHALRSANGTSAADRTPRAYIGLPLIFREKVFGVLAVQSFTPDAYTQDDVDLLATMTTQASIAIQNARAYEQLVQTAEQLREVDRLKTQFLANMSHELRTPLNSIIGFSRVMLKGIDGPLTDLQDADLTSIYTSGQHLLSLINSILDMSKIEAGKMDLAFDEVDLAEIFNAAMSTARALVKDEPVELRSEIPDDLPTVWADAQRVRQVLFNLLSNAAKFTPEGHITVGARTEGDWVVISVADTGIGIDPEAQRRLFIPFQQVDASTTRRAGGTGLGLAISRSFVQMHGGEIWVDSERGEGATFCFTLPIYHAAGQDSAGYQLAGQQAELAARAEGSGVAGEQATRNLVLAVDDDRGVITLLKRYLENDGYQVVGVSESPDALSLARQLAPRLVAITLDVVMPRMDGWQVLRALKLDPQTRDIPVVLCSIVEGLDQGLRLGAAACVRKPVTRDELLAVLKQIEAPAAA